MKVHIIQNNTLYKTMSVVQHHDQSNRLFIVALGHRPEHQSMNLVNLDLVNSECGCLDDIQA